MHAVVAFVLVCLAGWLLISALGRARSAAAQVRAATGKRSGIPRGNSQRPVRHEIKLAWEKAKAQDWLALRAHERKTGTGHAAAVTPAAKPAATVAVAAVMQRLRGKRPASSPANGKGQTVPDNAGPYGLPDEMGRPHLGDMFPRSAGRPAWKDNPPPHSNGSPGRTTTVAASGNAVEQLVEGVNQIHAHAQAGGFHAKHGGVKASHEGCARFSAMAGMLSRQMSEPGQHYGPEITEPIAKAGLHLQAAAMAWSEADAALTSLASMTVGDLAQSSRQAPSHTEMSENGSH